MGILSRKMNGVDDDETLMLFQELRLVTGVDPTGCAEILVSQYLLLCLHPFGGRSKAVKIEKTCMDSHDPFDRFILRKKVGRVGDGLHRMLRGFTDQRRETLENYFGVAVYMFLNRMLVPTKKKSHRRYYA